MKNDTNSEFDLASAIAASKNKKIWEWTIGYLKGHQRNKEVLENIQKRKIVTALLIEYPLELFESTTGPQNGEAEQESLPEWLKRTKEIEETIKNERIPPPIIVSDFWQKLYIIDGNHRKEALLKSGFKTYWTIFLFEKPDSEKKLFEELKKLKPMKIKAIIVDVGGVLVRERDKSLRKFWETKLHITERQLTKEVFRTGKATLATLGEIKPETIWLDIKDKYNLSEKEIKQLKQDFHAGDTLNTEFYTFMQDMNKNYKTAILSNAWLNTRQIYTKKYHLDKIVDVMIISAEEGIVKPNKKIFTLALQKLNVKPDEVIYVDDHAANITAAKALGMLTVLFTHTKETIEKIKSYL